MKIKLYFFGVLYPFMAIAAPDKPSMALLWIEIGLILAVLLILKTVSFSNFEKFIIFISYIMTGILTKTLWFPILVFIALFIYFKKSQNNDSN